MILKDSRNRLATAVRTAITRIYSGGIFRLAGYSLAVYLVGALSARPILTHVVKPIAKPMVTKAVRTYTYVRRLFYPPPAIVIDIKHEHFQKLAYKREMALLIDKLIVDENDYVPAKIRYGDTVVRAKLRLKGDHVDQLQGEKWSFRIRVKGDETLFGMKQFSIHHPAARYYIYEWVFHELLRGEGVLALRYKFVNVTLNGKDLGIYALEEHFDKRLVEHNELREGPIVRFNENLMWEEAVQFWYTFPNAKMSTYGSYLSSNVDAFQTNKILSDSTQYALFLTATDLLESFRSRKRTPVEVFDLRKLASYYAISDLLGADHGSVWHNVRFYYNPVTSLLEPIGFDGLGGRPLDSSFATRYGFYVGDESASIYGKYEDENYWAAMWRDEQLFAEYVKAVERISADSYLTTRMAQLHDDLSANEAIIQSEFPFQAFDIEVLRRNQAFMRAVLNPSKCLHAYLEGVGNDEVRLSLANIQPLPLIVTGIEVGNFLTRSDSGTVVTGKIPGRAPIYETRIFALPHRFAWSDSMAQSLTVRYKLLGTHDIREESVFPWPQHVSRFEGNNWLREREGAVDTDLLRVDSARKLIRLKPGKWQLKENLVIPSGYRVVGGPGLEIDLVDSASILSRSPLYLSGSEHAPIVFHSSDSTGQGVFVLADNQESVLDYVVFDNLYNPSNEGWALTGALTFYESPVKMSNCRFSDNRAEDALNLIRSDFEIKKSVFFRNSGDAIDIDYSTGAIMNSSFCECGNDAIDASGSDITLEGVRIGEVGDKGLSAGERSKVTFEHGEVSQAEIAIASKDQSEVLVKNVSVIDCKIGFTAFRKKSEFGPASISVSNVLMENVDVPYLIENLSRLIVDGKIRVAEVEGVRDLLYGVQYGKESD